MKIQGPLALAHLPLMRLTRHSLALSFAVTLTCPLMAWAAPYELRVYSDDIPKQQDTEVEIIQSFSQPKSSSEKLPGRVAQTLMELGYGISNTWSAGLELPMSHVGGQHRLEGLKVEVQYVPEHNSQNGLYWGVRSDVGYTSSPYETQGSQSLDINPILGYRWSSWHVVINPSIERPLSGTDKQVQFQPSAKIAHALNGTTQLGLEYFSAWGALSAIRPQRQRDETLYLVWDEALTTSRWNLGLGKPLNPSGGSADKWVIKVGVNFDID